MSVIGLELDSSSLVLTKGRDFKWGFKNVDESGVAVNYPPGSLFIELYTSPVTKWPFTISGSEAVCKVESEEVDKIPSRTHWQLVFLPQGEVAGGDPVARGTVKVQV
jgi:hypothetical protein